MSYVLSGEAEQELAHAAAFYLAQASVAVARAFLDEFTRTARPPPWTTLHRLQPARSPLIDRGKLFRRAGPLLLKGAIELVQELRMILVLL